MSNGDKIELTKSISYDFEDYPTHASIQYSRNSSLVSCSSIDVPLITNIKEPFYVTSPYDVSGFSEDDHVTRKVTIYDQPLEAKRVAVVYDFAGYAWCAALFCFCPTGLIALFKSFKVRKALQQDDSLAAEEAAEEARMYSACSIITGIICIAIFILLIAVFNIL